MIAIKEFGKGNTIDFKYPRIIRVVLFYLILFYIGYFAFEKVGKILLIRVICVIFCIKRAVRRNHKKVIDCIN
ncbi:hypothetical protein LCGC14_0119070 [marine sediment metagenome]|uniref:Uncharacterized protein n=1 Tax=marine sediment metagenome TaxID=412755 RepID=A0A0F9Y9G0_9ZZZZ